jgi:secernin
MAGDMVVVLGRASGGERALFGHNSHRLPGEGQRLVRLPGRLFAPGEAVQLPQTHLAQARQTFTVVGSQPAGCWGLQHGLNEHRVAVGCSSWSSRLTCPRPALSGPDLTRLALERGRSARQAVDVLIDLISRYGQGRPETGGEGADSAFLVADPHEAFAVEAAGRAWVVQEIYEVRAASDVAIIRQDWTRIAPGLAADVIERGWHEADGSKLDFAGSLSISPVGQASALRRWGRATFLLEQESSRIDTAFVRRLLGDHYEGTHFEADPIRGTGEPVPLCRHAGSRDRLMTTTSLVAELPAEPGALALAWWAFGPPCVSVYFPVFVEADLPAALAGDVQALPAGGVGRWQQRLGDRLGRDPARWRAARERLGQLQARFDQDAADFAAEARTLMREGQREQFGRLAGLLTQSHIERFEDVVCELLAIPDRAALSSRD